MLLYLIKIFGFFIIVAAIAIGVGELFQSSGFIRLSNVRFRIYYEPIDSVTSIYSNIFCFLDFIKNFWTY